MRSNGMVIILGHDFVTILKIKVHKIVVPGVLCRYTSFRDFSRSCFKWSCRMKYKYLYDSLVRNFELTLRTFFISYSYKIANGIGIVFVLLNNKNSCSVLLW